MSRHQGRTRENYRKGSSIHTVCAQAPKLNYFLPTSGAAPVRRDAESRSGIHPYPEGVHVGYTGRGLGDTPTRGCKRCASYCSCHDAMAMDVDQDIVYRSGVTRNAFALKYVLTVAASAIAEFGASVVLLIQDSACSQIIF